MIFQPIVNLAQICFELGVRNVILCPGSRSAPIILAFSRNSNFQLYSINDERSAGFIGLGMAIRTQSPVVIVCTSGTAVYNLAPAVAEAFFQQLPLIVLTADRPPEWTDQWDGQTIRQDNIFGTHVKKFFKLPTDLDHSNSRWQVERMTSEALNLCQSPTPGPVHINCPFREPFYPTDQEELRPSADLRVIRTDNGVGSADSLNWEALMTDWNQSPSKLIIVGQNSPDKALRNILKNLSVSRSIPVITDILANQMQPRECIRMHDSFLMQHNGRKAGLLRPNLLITIGKSVISKNLKLFLRVNRPDHHWHVSPEPQFADPFQSLTRGLAVSPVDFLTELDSRMPVESGFNPFLKDWTGADNQINDLQNDFFENKPFSEFEAVRIVLQNLVPATDLHLGNSMPVRYANLLASSISEDDIEVYGNRGTSGIDGCLSTAVGNALTTDRQVLLLIGDVSFFYDRNGLWHRHKPNNLKVIVLNNHGGGIFRLIDGASNQPELEDYFVGSQDLRTANTALDYKMPYFESSSSEQLTAILPEFLDRNTGSAILEITTDPDLNTTIFNEYKTLIKDDDGA